MANKNNSSSPKGRFLTLQFRLIVNSTILETKKNKTFTAYVDNRGPDQPMLIWASVIHICKKRSWFQIF